MISLLMQEKNEKEKEKVFIETHKSFLLLQGAGSTMQNAVDLAG